MVKLDRKPITSYGFLVSKRRGKRRVEVKRTMAISIKAAEKYFRTHGYKIHEYIGSRRYL